MRSKILEVAMLFTAMAAPSAQVAEPIHTAENSKEETKIAKAIKAEIDGFSLPTKEETAEKQIEKYVKRLEEERKKKEAAKKAAREEAARKKAAEAAKKAAPAPSNVTLPDSNPCVVAMKKVFPRHLWQTGYAIMRAESGARPNAVGGPNFNGTYDYGCWQINNSERALDPDVGTQIAWYKYNHSGWTPWVVYNTGSYLRFF